jgi:hypothetical protein
VLIENRVFGVLDVCFTKSKRALQAKDALECVGKTYCKN